MLKQLVECVLSVLNLARDTRTNKEEIVELRRELDELATAVEHLSFELRAVREEDPTNATNCSLGLRTLCCV